MSPQYETISKTPVTISKTRAETAHIKNKNLLTIRRLKKI